MNRKKFNYIDLIIVNFYPFQETIQKIKNRAVKTSKLSTEISHFLEAHNFSYCPNPHNSYFGKIFELVKDIYKVQRTKP